MSASINELPFVSVVTPTYNRRKFIPYLIQMYEQQTYPKHRMEWVILDDGVDKVEDLFLEASKKIPNIRYIYEPDKMLIGAKRNRLNAESAGSIIIAMDDDDYYPPERVSHVVARFKANPKIDLAGSSEIYIYFSDNQTIYRCGPYGPNHATNGTMAWRKRYADTHTYNEIQTHAEESSFLDNYVNPMIQLDPKKVMLVMSHSDNTFDKRIIRDNDANSKIIKKTSHKIRDFIANKELREFFASA
jgi:glycosyltransferase involved in cell wall biosynthesis